VVIGLDGGIGKGSARSVSGVDLGASVQRLAQEGLLIKGGGHKMAAGLTVAEDRMEEAMARLSELLARQGAGAVDNAEKRRAHASSYLARLASMSARIDDTLARALKLFGRVIARQHLIELAPAPDRLGPGASLEPRGPASCRLRA
jgi:hypothetical protein